MRKKNDFQLVVSMRVWQDVKMRRQRRVASDRSNRRSYYALRWPPYPSIRIVNPLRDFSEQIGASFG